MRQVLLLGIDLVLILFATIAAFLLRVNINVSVDKVIALSPYLAFTTGISAVTILMLGVHCTIWRYSALSDYSRLLVATAAIVIGAVALGFGFNRLDGVPRSLPILQALLIPTVLVGARVIRRALRSLGERDAPVIMDAKGQTNCDTVLVVGLNRLTSLYLQAVEQIAKDRVHIAGLVAENPLHIGNLVGGKRILGSAEELSKLISELEIHGVFVNRLVVSMPLPKLSLEVRRQLFEIEKTSAINVEILSEQLGLTPTAEANSERKTFLGVDEFDHAAIKKQRYLRLRRIFERVGAGGMLVLMAPLLPVLALLVAYDVGMPVVFWQQRPGLNGRPFKLYKFRTMIAAHDESGVRVPDEDRFSAIGRFMRYTRFDELPQLFNILKGEMSFIGPRPLLPVDQPAHTARLLVRPGLTGWAQVMGGRAISPSDKSALDVWYVRNASLAVDLKIILHTIKMIICGERVDDAAIRDAWNDLERTKICAEFATAEDTPNAVAFARIDEPEMAQELL